MRIVLGLELLDSPLIKSWVIVPGLRLPVLILLPDRLLWRGSVRGLIISSICLG